MLDSTLQDEMRQILRNLTHKAIYIAAEQPHIRNYTIIAQNDRKNNIPGDSDTFYEI